MSDTTTQVFPQYTPLQLSCVNRFTRKKAAEPPTGAASQPEFERALADPRAQLIWQLMRKCDADQDGRLIVGELRAFAILTGFDASEDEWAEEYQALCGQRGTDPVVGLEFKEFQAFLDDESATGQHCSDDELRDLIDNFDAKLREGHRLVDANLEKQPPQQSEEVALSVQTAQEEQLKEEMEQSAQAQTQRELLIKKVFEFCDVGGDRHLTEAELRTFAQQTGFDGSEIEWAEEYAMLCMDCGVLVSKGLRFEDFSRLLEDETDAGQYCTHAELEELVDNFENIHSGARLGLDQPQPVVAEASRAIAAAAELRRPTGKRSQPLAVKKEMRSSREPPAPVTTKSPKEEARGVPDAPPPWLPLKKESVFLTTGDEKRSRQVRQKDLLRAALDQKPVLDVVGPAMNDLNGLSRGRLDGPDKGKGKGDRSVGF